MATKPRNNQQTPKTADALIINKGTFKAKLLERIDLGKALVSRGITNVDELEKNEKDYYKWDSYNSEFLKSSFNNENNDYKSRYDRVNNSFLIAVGGNSLTERLKDLKKDIQNK